MSSFPKQEEIVAAILKGITTAKENFLFWTNDRLTLSYGPQKIITIHVAQEIAKIQNPPEIFIDATVADILRCSLPDRNSFENYMRDSSLSQGTFSITLDERFVHQNDNDSITRGIVSVNSGVINTKLEYTNEVERICIMLDRELCKISTLDFGIFAFYSDISSIARKKLNNRIPQIISNFDKIVQNHKNLKSTFKGGDIITTKDSGEWCAGCYIIEPMSQPF